jgi:hypothetical protein
MVRACRDSCRSFWTLDSHQSGPQNNRHALFPPWAPASVLYTDSIHSEHMSFPPKISQRRTSACGNHRTPHPTTATTPSVPAPRIAKYEVSPTALSLAAPLLLLHPFCHSSAATADVQTRQSGIAVAESLYTPFKTPAPPT